MAKTTTEKEILADQNGAPRSSASPFMDQMTTHNQAEQQELGKMQTIARDQQRVATEPATMVSLPNRGMARLADLIDHDYVAEDHRSIFADAHKYIKDPKPGALYCWPAIQGKAANQTFAMERMGYYRRVEASELRDDIDIPIYTHKTATGEYICCYDVCLMEQPAEVVRKLREHPKQGAILRTAQAAAYGDFAARTRDLTGGAARASMTVSSDDGRTVEFQD